MNSVVKITTGAQSPSSPFSPLPSSPRCFLSPQTLWPPHSFTLNLIRFADSQPPADACVAFIQSGLKTVTEKVGPYRGTGTPPSRATLLKLLNPSKSIRRLCRQQRVRQGRRPALPGLRFQPSQLRCFCWMGSPLLSWWGFQRGLVGSQSAKPLMSLAS